MSTDANAAKESFSIHLKELEIDINSLQYVTWKNQLAYAKVLFLFSWLQKEINNTLPADSNLTGN